MKKLLKKFMGEETYTTLLNRYKDLTGGHSIKSYSQEGEDLILLREFENYGKGFYIDIGAYHPRRFSNTYLFYLRGWRGINIDARPGSMNIFNKQRPRDINLEIPVSEKAEEMKFYTFNEPAVSGFHEELSIERAKKDGYRIVKTETMISRKLSSVLDEYLPEGTEISFMSVDVEGHDYNVLISNNWEKYKPLIILVEDLASTLEASLSSDVSKLLTSFDYYLFAKTPNTCFYKK